MKIMEVERIVVGAVQTNCYLLHQDGNIVLIDPADSPRRIIRKMEAHGDFHLLAILLTHGHFDHIGAVDDLVSRYHCPVYGCRDDEKMLRNRRYNSMGPLGCQLDCEISWLQGDTLDIGPFHFRVLYTPGHTEGSVMYLIEDMLFSGDTLFRRSVGRTDLYGGSYGQLMQSLQVIRTLDEKTVVWPGHEEPTTVGEELEFNPYLQ
ncbi:MAG: MBL fold metallo-hydrolase [Erysipelotrichaceae bacterium]|nr:MBL fold metallo-hydrolase [Erysipelotrichaceae bacterium]MBO4537449.1 MBL fold metallo-hydrolase [Erysipelotrichaceae bacterium]